MFGLGLAVIFALAFVATLVFVWVRTKNGSLALMLAMSLGTFGSFFVVAPMQICFERDQEPTEVLSEVVYLGSLSDSAGIRGNFHGSLLFAHGSITSAQRYDFYIEEPTGSLVPDTVVPYNRNVRIRQFESSATQRPRLEIYHLTCSEDVAWYVKAFSVCKVRGASYTFFVPEGTVEEVYSLDSQ